MDETLEVEQERGFSFARVSDRNTQVLEEQMVELLRSALPRFEVGAKEGDLDRRVLVHGRFGTYSIQPWLTAGGEDDNSLNATERIAFDSDDAANDPTIRIHLPRGGGSWTGGRADVAGLIKLVEAG